MALGADVYTDVDLDDHSQTAAIDIMQHINLAKWPDLIIVAPVTANTISQIACGFGNNLLTETLLASRVPVYLAPAMNI